MSTIDRILAGLIQRTLEGKLKWERTAERDVFITVVDTVSVEISGVGTWDAEYNLVVTGDYDNVVDRLDYNRATQNQRRQLQQLHASARRSALDVDAVLEKLAQGLQV